MVNYSLNFPQKGRIMKVEKKESSPCVLALSVTAEAAEIKEE